MNELLQRLANLPPEKRNLILKKLQQQGAGQAENGHKAAQIERLPRDGGLPLSFAQQRLWFLDQLQPGNAVYNLPTAVRLTGRIDISVLERSLNAIIQRHESLRTTFRMVAEQPVQIIAPTLTMRLPVLDVRGLPAVEQDIEVRRRITEEARRPFDLTQGPLVRGQVLQLGAEDHVLLLVMHHIIADAWSKGILMRELKAIYSAWAQQPVSESQPLPDQPLLARLPLPPLPIQYADYAVWQRQQLQGDVLAKQLAYWKQQLQNMPAMLDLPTDHTRPAVQTSCGARQLFMLPATFVESLTALSRQTDSTLFMALLTAFKILLYRYTGQHDVVVGSAIANRNRTEIEGLIGFFVNTLVMRTDLSGSPTFRESLRRIREVTVGAYTHQDVPFEALVEELRPERHINLSPLFQVALSFHNVPVEPLHMPGLHVTPLEVDTGTTVFDLSFAFLDTEGGLQGTVEYSTELFDRATITRLIGHFQVLLESSVASPDRRINDLPLLTVAEQQVLTDWNVTQSAYQYDQCIHQLFEAQTARTPDAIALVFKDQHLSYAELDRRACLLAQHLRRIDAGLEVPVGICMERSLELVVGLLGVLKAGGIYVPLDPAYPAERLAFMIEDAQVQVLLVATKDERRRTNDEGRTTNERTTDDCRLPTDKAGHLVTLSPCHLVNLETDWPLIAAEPAELPRSSVTPDNLAYVIYTSGSTGRPKGVLVTHGNLAHTLAASQQQFALTSQDTMPWMASAMFDIALFELFAPLLQGGTVIILTRDQVLDLPQLLAILTRCTILHTVPSLMQALVQELGTAGAIAAGLRLRLIFLGGDAVPPALLDALRDVFPQAALWVGYGPTEGAIISTHYRVPRDQPLLRPMLGQPLPGVRTWILDARQHLMPIGIPGELYLGGSGVTLGYLNRPELTATQFVPNPFAGDTETRRHADKEREQSAIGYRLYRTGDLARWRPDGQLEFLGRIDHQVKIRGYRIEVGEIEAVLSQHPSIQESVVVAREDVPGDRRLVAYLVPAQASSHVQSRLKLREVDGLSHADRQTYRLPNGLGIFHQGEFQASKLYDEIFDQRIYLQHGISLSDGDCVFDVGANIGLFTLFVQHVCSGAKVYSFEPLPPTFEVLHSNIALYDLDVKLFDYGLSDKAGTADFTFYPHMSGLSGRYANITSDIQAFKLSSTAWLKAVNADQEHEVEIQEQISDLLEHHLLDHAETYVCKLRTLSDILAEQNIEKIDLLKIDVEKSELDVLKGIKPADWAKIRQIVIEVEGSTLLHEIKALLYGHGYDVLVDEQRSFDALSDQEPQLQVFILYARREGIDRQATRTSVPAFPIATATAGANRPLVQTIQTFLSEKLPAYMIPSAFVVLDALPLTRNGKLDRAALPPPDSGQSALATGYVAPRTPIERTLAAIWATLLRQERVGIHDNFFALGGDSILSIQILARARQAGLYLSPRQIFQHQTIASLATVVTLATQLQPEQSLVSGSLPLTPIQRRFFEQLPPIPQHWNQAVMLAVRDRLSPIHLSQALDALADHHDALRLRFSRTPAGWRQFNAGSTPAPAIALDWADLSALAGAAQTTALRQLADELHTRLDLSHGPLARAAYFDLGATQPARLLLVIHHLAVDGVSWRVLLEDVQTAYQQLRAGQPPTLPPKTSSFLDWAHRLADYAQTSALQAELAYWRALPWAQVAPLPLDHPLKAGENIVASARQVTVALSAAETHALLHAVPPVYRTRIDEVLLTALALVLARWSGAQVLLLDLEGHGREALFEDLDLSRTVGWFTAVAPVLLDLRGVVAPGAALKTIKEQLRRRPNHGMSYGLLRYLSEDASVREELRALPQAQISFNYLGQFDQVLAGSAHFGPALEESGAAQAPQTPRAYLLEISGSVFEEQLRISITYSTALHQRVTITQFADDFVTALRELIAHCRSPEAGGYTPSDFPLLALDQAALDEMLKTLPPLAADAAAGRALPRIEDIYPLTPVQAGMLFHHLYDRTSEVYVEQMSCTLEGELDVAAFARAWAVVIERHAVLRTALVWEGLSEPLQVVYEQVELPLETQDWRALPAPEQAAQLVAYQTAEQARGFDLRQPPLMRLALLRLGENSYRLLWSHHHVLMDGWCLSVLLKEVLSYYAAFSRGLEVELPPSAPYSSYIAWLQRQDLSQAEAYWRESLAGLEAPTPLPLDMGAGRGDAAETVQYAEEHFQLAAEAGARLHTFARQQRVTMNTLVQGAWARVLNGYSSVTDVLYGATVSGRPPNLPGIEAMIGLFINTLPIRVQLPLQARVAAWLQELQARQVELRQYEYSPLVQVQGWSALPRGQALFESLVVFENYPIEAGLLDQVSELVISEIGAVERTNYPLTLIVVEREELLLRLSYQTHRFEAAGMARLLGHLAVVLDGMAASPERRVAELSLLTAAEQQQILRDWNTSSADLPREAVIHQLFAEQAARTPDAIALVCAEQQLSYGALHARANQLAHSLQAHGVGPDTLVGVYLERSFDLIIALLGILTAGGAYVPLDPTYPATRIAFMLADTQVSVLLTQRRHAADIPVHPATMLCLDADWSGIATARATTPPNRTTADHLAYVIYTSGSTGHPKGVSIPHRAVIRLVQAPNYVHLTPSDVFLQLASAAFDAATFEVWGSLLNGARLVIMPPHLPALAEVAHLIQQQCITTLWLTAGLFEVMAEAHAGVLSQVRQLLAGGDVLSASHVQRVLNADGGGTLINGYGPTENTTFTCCHPLTDSTAIGNTVPIGRPITRTSVYLCDSAMQLVPVGGIGELYTGGDGLARGYLNRPDLTAERFVPNPFTSTNDERRTTNNESASSSFIVHRSSFGERLYKTGDLARYCADGTIEFLGRIDQQVKIRGYRIELGEIEAVLARHPKVRNCVVLAQVDDSGDKRLVAYVVATSTAALEAEQLHRFLQTQLPSYMVPSLVVLLAALPLTPNGKLDRRALPAPNVEPDASDFVAPRTPLEELLVNIWADVLGLPHVGIHDNFFALGGHSLLATQVIAQVQAVLNAAVSVRSIFEAPTIAALAKHLEATRRVGQPAPPAIRVVPRDGELRLSFAQQRLWFLDQLMPNSPVYNIPLAVRLLGRLDAAALAKSLRALMQRHETLRTTFRMAEQHPIQVIASRPTLRLALLDLQVMPAAPQAATLRGLAESEARQPFNLTHGPLLRAVVLRLSATEQVLFLTLHHIIADGWSMEVLVRELALLHTAQRAGQPDPLPPLPIQYADYAAWQRQWLQGAVLERQVAYWRTQLADAPGLLELPTDYPRPRLRTFQGAQQHSRLSSTLSAELLRVSHQAGVTLFMTLFMAFQLMLARYSGQEDLLVGTPIANRTRSETKGLIGFFVNTLVLRTRLVGAPTIQALLEQVRTVALDAYTHQDLPFEHLVEELQPDRELNRHPLFQVLFALQNTPPLVLELPELSIEPLVIAGVTAKFDLSVAMNETPQGLVAMWEYSTELFEATTIARMAGHFQTLLNGIVADPTRRVTDLPLLTDAERHQLLAEWNATEVFYLRDASLAALFEAQVARTPDAIALQVVNDERGTMKRVDGGFTAHRPSFIVQISYAELNAHANQLAHRLRTLGVGPNVCVAICLPRTPALLVGMLAILKAGGAYVPLDPSMPPARLASMLAETKPPVLLTQRDLLASLPPATSYALCLDATTPDDATPITSNPPHVATADQLAYVIYTSGSTGIPKGVAVPQRGVARLVCGAAYTQLDATRRLLHLAPIAFDAATFEVWGALLHGACCVLAPAHMLSVAALGDVLAQFKVCTLWLTAALFNTVIDQAPEVLAGVRQLLIGGEALSVAHVQRALASLPHTRIVNGYGPTESTTFTCCYPIPSALAPQTTTIPIGHPIGNTTVYILDRQFQLVPVGMPGELYISGDGLARGYFNQPALTAERFIPNPFARVSGIGSQVSEDAVPNTRHPIPDTRLYRTGDLARHRSDGNIEFLGRIDQLVKIRGFRIELGEIEVALARHPAVQAAAVAVHEVRENDKRLVAYIVPTNVEHLIPYDEVTATDHADSAITRMLRTFLNQQLPAYMVPSAFVLLERFPLTPHGKLDRLALPPPELTQYRAESEFVAPRTPTEELMAQLWSEVLGHAQVGIHDNFFEVGGHSLLATQLITHIRDTFQIELPLRSLFGAPTIARLSEIIQIEMVRGTDHDLQNLLGATEEDLEEGNL